ncbi:hypothetical protein N783_05435 [Pontibacillus marinus BH030004 = DSM 16465]|uniref:Uncharacterized protein n=1 Tax=Pontibacillus marinus BH030004 = DSM 16465 TaxID=1385511 RepID=A0A0A5I150_9BACI|nr:hypothetical protein N783_05435 [Pontibacillus marinus BH030004 = DSM 16465]
MWNKVQPKRWGREGIRKKSILKEVIIPNRGLIWNNSILDEINYSE